MAAATVAPKSETTTNDAPTWHVSRYATYAVRCPVGVVPSEEAKPLRAALSPEHLDRVAERFAAKVEQRYDGGLLRDVLAAVATPGGTVAVALDPAGLLRVADRHTGRVAYLAPIVEGA